jgi:serine/threonine-protein kinase
MRLTLTVESGPNAGRVFTLTRHDTFLMGRSKHAHLQLPPTDRYCSRIHCMVEFNPPLCRIIDLGSNNGTYVNGKRQPVADLADGDRIRAGRTTLRVGLDQDASTALESSADDQETVTRSPEDEVPPAAESDPAVCIACEAVLDVRERGLAEASPVLCQVCRQRMAQYPQMLPGYQLLRQVGRGGMGVVHLA